MKPLTLAVTGLAFAGIISPATAATPIEQRIGSVPPNMYRAMSGNFPAARGYTGDLSLLVPATKVNTALGPKREVVKVKTPKKELLDAFRPAQFPAYSPLKLQLLPENSTNRTVPSSGR